MLKSQLNVSYSERKIVMRTPTEHYVPGTVLHTLIYLTQQTHEVNTIVVPIRQMRKLKRREGGQFAQHHRPIDGQSLDLYMGVWLQNPYSQPLRRPPLQVLLYHLFYVYQYLKFLFNYLLFVSSPFLSENVTSIKQDFVFFTIITLAA